MYGVNYTGMKLILQAVLEIEMWNMMRMLCLQGCLHTNTLQNVYESRGAVVLGCIRGSGVPLLGHRFVRLLAAMQISEEQKTCILKSQMALDHGPSRAWLMYESAFFMQDRKAEVELNAAADLFEQNDCQPGILCCKVHILWKRSSSLRIEERFQSMLAISAWFEAQGDWNFNLLFISKAISILDFNRHLYSSREEARAQYLRNATGQDWAYQMQVARVGQLMDDTESDSKLINTQAEILRWLKVDHLVPIIEADLLKALYQCYTNRDRNLALATANQFMCCRMSRNNPYSKTLAVTRWLSSRFNIIQAQVDHAESQRRVDIPLLDSVMPQIHEIIQDYKSWLKQDQEHNYKAEAQLKALGLSIISLWLSRSGVKKPYSEYLHWSNIAGSTRQMPEQDEGRLVEDIMHYVNSIDRSLDHTAPQEFKLEVLENCEKMITQRSEHPACTLYSTIYLYCYLAAKLRVIIKGLNKIAKPSDAEQLSLHLNKYIIKIMWKCFIQVWPHRNKFPERAVDCYDQIIEALIILSKLDPSSVEQYARHLQSAMQEYDLLYDSFRTKTINTAALPQLIEKLTIIEGTSSWTKLLNFFTEFEILNSNHVGAWERFQRCRSQSFLDALRGQRVDDKILDSPYGRRSQIESRSRENSHSPDFVFVDWFFCLTSSEVYRVIVANGLPVWSKIQITRGNINAWVRRYLQFPLAGFKPLEQDTKALHRFNLPNLLSGLEDHCEPGSLIVLGLSKDLAEIPIHAIPLNRRPLIARNPIVYAANYETFRILEDRIPEVASLNDATFMASYDSANFPRETEILETSMKTLAQFYGGKAIVGDALTSEAFKSGLQARWVHYHGHVKYDPEMFLGHSFVFTRHNLDKEQPLDTSPEDGVNKHESVGTGIQKQLLSKDERVTMTEIFDIDLTTNRPVVLAIACDSIVQQMVSGEEPTGLATALLCAGASTVVGSLWPLRSSDGRKFSEVFYKHLNHCIHENTGSVDLSRLLQQTLSVLRGLEDSTPYQWASFCLIGARWFHYKIKELAAPISILPAEHLVAK